MAVKIDTLVNRNGDTIVPRTLTKAITDDNNNRLDQVLENMVSAARTDEIPSTEIEASIDADLLEGHPASYFTNASNITSGTLPIARGGTGAASASAALSALGGASTKTYTATLTTTWSGSSAPYTQTVTVSGITSSDTPIVDVVLSTTNSTAISQLEAWGCVSKITTGTNSITATCLEDKPTTAIPIQLQVVK